jgi:glycosyltransferase involved in cell wall biosynthesis
MQARRLLIITYYFPPRPLIGAARWAAMSEWLRRLGHEVTVVTSRIGASPGAEDPWVLRTFDLSTVGPVRKLLRRRPVPRSGTLETVRKPAPRWFSETVVPDEFLLTWSLAALASIRRLVRERRIECLITSGPPHSAHLLPLLLGHHRPGWIVDLRDGWRFEPARAAWPASGQDRLDALLERVVLCSAEQVIGVTRPIASDAHARLGARSVYVPNGWDPAWDGGRTERGVGTVADLLDHDCINVVHTGTLSGARGRDPQPVFEALQRVARGRSAAARPLRLVLAGSLSDAEERLLSDLDLCVSVEHVGGLDRESCLALQRDADVLLLLTSATDVSVATGKLFEYLGAGRPILALASGNEAARIVGETRTGAVVHPHDVDGIVRVLEAAVDGTLGDLYAPRHLARYAYPHVAEEVSGLIEPAIALRAASLALRRPS